MKFYLRDINPELAEEWNKFFGDNPDFDISTGDIFAGPKVDAIISPSNSHGFLNGGIDAVYVKKFNPQIEYRLQERINKYFYGELPVGQATILPTGDSDYRYLISAPTMRVPSVVKGTANAYLAFRAALIAVKKHNVKANPEPHIHSILCPGLGTATGHISCFLCAKQMYEAYKAIWLDQPVVPKDCAEAYYYHQSLIGWKMNEFKIDGKDVTIHRKGEKCQEE